MSGTIAPGEYLTFTFLITYSASIRVRMALPGDKPAASLCRHAFSYSDLPNSFDRAFLQPQRPSNYRHYQAAMVNWTLSVLQYLCLWAKTCIILLLDGARIHNRY